MKRIYLAISLVAFVGGYAQKQDSIKTQNIQSVMILGKQKYQKGLTHISRNDLDIIQANTLGETLGKIPGIQNTYYGPNSGTPMIRSLTGNRIKIVRNGISMNDLSGISPDYNIDFDAENIQSMEVYKGASPILFGGKAIGGAVNIQTQSIPKSLAEKPISATILMEGTTNDGFRQNIKLEGNAGKHLSWFARLSHSGRDFVRVPNETKSDYCRDPKVVGFSSVMQALCQMNVASGYQLNYTVYPYISQFVLDNLNNPAYGLNDDDKYTFDEFDPVTKLPNPKNPSFIDGQDPIKDRYRPYINSIKDYGKTEKGKMPNSHAEKKSVNLGIGYIGKNIQTGIGYEGDFSYYGVPGYALYGEIVHSHSGGHHYDYSKTEMLPINIDLKNHRLISESKIDFNTSPIKTINLKYAGQWSENSELLGDNKVNSFGIKQHGVRVELNQRQWRFWSGITGLDYEYRKISGSGDQRYMPNTLSDEWGIFTLQKIHFKTLKIDLGYRHDEAHREVLLSSGYKTSRGLAGGKLQKRDFGLHHFSASARWDFFKKFYLIGSYTHAERAPEINELYTGNDHFALLIEENGDDTHQKEQSKTREIGIGAAFKNFRFSLTAYHSDFKNYLYLGHTGIVRSGLVVKEWRAGDTQIEGIELSSAYRFALGQNSAVEIDGFYDLVKNKNTSDNAFRKRSDGDFMPNMPTSRMGFGISGALQKWVANLSFERYLEQKNLGKNIDPELAMPAYNLLSARLSYNAEISKIPIEFYLFGKNLLNTTARPQNSLLKFVAPLPAINIGFGVKAIL